MINIFIISTKGKYDYKTELLIKQKLNFLTSKIKKFYLGFKAKSWESCLWKYCAEYMIPYCKFHLDEKQKNPQIFLSNEIYQWANYILVIRSTMDKETRNFINEAKERSIKIKFIEVKEC